MSEQRFPSLFDLRQAITQARYVAERPSHEEDRSAAHSASISGQVGSVYFEIRAARVRLTFLLDEDSISVTRLDVGETFEVLRCRAERLWPGITQT